MLGEFDPAWLRLVLKLSRSPAVRSRLAAQLHSLDLTGWNITPTQFTSFVPPLRSLERLVLQDNPQLTSQVLVGITSLTRLTHLVVGPRVK